MRRGERAWAGWGWHREDWRCGGRGGGASTRPHASRRGAHTHLLARARALTTRHTGSPPHPRHAGIPRAPQKPITRVDCCLPRPMRRLTNDKHMSDEPTLMSFENLHVLGHTCLAARLGGARAECDCGEALTRGPPPPPSFRAHRLLGTAGMSTVGRRAPARVSRSVGTPSRAPCAPPCSFLCAHGTRAKCHDAWLFCPARGPVAWRCRMWEPPLSAACPVPVTCRGRRQSVASPAARAVSVSDFVMKQNVRDRRSWND